MVRTARYLQENACYHVISRAIYERQIFLDDSDYEWYRVLIRKYKTKFEIKLYAFCLMPNHVHLVVRPLEPKRMSVFMKNINQIYAQYFNTKYSRYGHLWQSRFKSMVISDGDYLLRCVEYVERNPVRADICKTIMDYKWSSYRLRILGVDNDICDALT